MDRVSNSTTKSLTQRAAEAVTKQTLDQLSTEDVMKILGSETIKRILQQVAHNRPSDLLAALPRPHSNPSSWWWIASDEWFYKSPGSPFRIQWNSYADRPRCITLSENGGTKRTSTVTAEETSTIVLPILSNRYGVHANAIEAFLRAALDYYTRTAMNGKWFDHSKTLGATPTATTPQARRNSEDNSDSDFHTLLVS